MAYWNSQERLARAIAAEDSAFIEAIRANVEAFCIENGFNWQEQIYSDSRGYLDITDCEIQYGASKIVLIPEGWNWVIKIPVIGYNDYTCSGYNSYDNYSYSGENWYEDYEEALSRELESNGYKFPIYDYCAAECALGYEAEKAGLGNIFVPTYYVGTYHDIPYYIQPRIENMRKDVFSEPNSQIRYRELNAHHYREFNDRFGGALFEQYGEEGVKSILNFLYVWGIGDLTSFSNYAVVNEKIVFFDYSGFNN